MSSSNNPVITGDNTVLFGTNGYYSGSGVVVSGNKKLEGDRLDLRDENGFVFTSIYFDDKNQFSFEMIVKTAAPELERGDLITVAGVANAEVQDTELIYEQTRERRYRVNATRFLGKDVGGS